MPVLPQQVNLGRPYKMGLNYPLLRGKWDLWREESEYHLQQWDLG